jgi:hypothetical protein
MRNTAEVTSGKTIVWLQSISGGNSINPLVAFYDIHGRKREETRKITREISREKLVGNFFTLPFLFFVVDSRFGVVVGILAYYARSRGFDLRTICVRENICLYWIWMFLCIMCMYLQKKKYRSMFIRFLYRLHNTSLIQAYFWLFNLELNYTTNGKCYVGSLRTYHGILNRKVNKVPHADHTVSTVSVVVLT